MRQSVANGAGERDWARGKDKKTKGHQKYKNQGVRTRFKRVCSAPGMPEMPLAMTEVDGINEGSGFYSHCGLRQQI